MSLYDQVKPPPRSTSRSDAERGACCSWHEAMIALSLVIAVLTIALVGVSVAVSTRADTLYRVCVETTPVGEPAPAKLIGTIEFDSYDATISYRLQQAGAIPMSSATALQIRGPLAPGDTAAPVFIALCGAPNLINVCDDVTVPGVLQGILRDVSSQVQAIRTSPHLYYGEVLTTAVPATPGAARFSLTGECGFA